MVCRLQRQSDVIIKIKEYHAQSRKKENQMLSGGP